MKCRLDLRPLIVLYFVPLAGCFSYHRSEAAPRDPEPLAADAWPVFDPSPLAPLLEMPEEIVLYEFDRDVLRSARPDISDERLDAMIAATQPELTSARLEPHGLVRFWSYRDRPRSRGGRDGFLLLDRRLENFVRDGQFLSPGVAAHEQELRRIRSSAGDQGGGFAAVFLRMYGITINGFADEWQWEDGIGLGLPRADQDQPVGLIVHISSLIENRYEHQVLRRMMAYGWAVAHMDSDIFVDGPNALAAAERSAERSRRFRELEESEPNDLRERVKAENRVYTRQEIRQMGEASLRRWEQVNQELPRLDMGFEITPETDLQRLGALIAGTVDTRLAEHAFAAEVLVRESEARMPSLSERPVVVMGFSAGAMAAPTVAARIRELYPDRKVLLVMVGGGASLLDIAHGSSLTSGGIRLKPISGAEPTPDQIAEVKRAYESATRLDPIKAAAAIRTVPVLHIYASRDSVVPTSAAVTFNTVHGSVDRLVHHGNHDTLFYFLSQQAGRVRSWLRSHGVE